MKSIITINGSKIEVEGGANSISISNGEIRIGGVLIQSGLSGKVDVHWSGPLANLTADGSVTVAGNVEGYVSAGGSVHCEDVKGSINAGGSVRCGKVGGHMNAGGSIKVN